MRYIVFLFISFIIIGCGNDTHPPEPIDKDDTYDAIAIYDESSAVAPYTYDKFKKILDGSNLQYPDKKTVIEAGEFGEYKSEIFYCDADGYLHFTIDKNSSLPKMRSELREIREWDSATKVAKHWYARLKIPKPKKGVDSYTWMQIHGTNDTYNFPILRFLWARSYQGKYDHLWAIIITNAPREPSRERGSDAGIVNDYNWIDLGARPSKFFDVDVDIKDNLMVISINDAVSVYKDISYWSSVSNYFKGGVYINRQDDVGSATVIFDQMTTN